MKKILLSVGILAVVGAIVVGATGAFYGDTETSTGNTFTAGSIELKVDSESHYNGMVCEGDAGWQDANDPTNFGSPVGFPTLGSDCDGTWAEADLVDGIHKFFYFTDLKPGDHGEDTISLHVYDNDAWGQFVIDGIIDRDNTCTGPEKVAEGEGVCVDSNGDGEIDNYLAFTAWLDQGSIPGFQNIDAEGNPILEGDNNYDPTEGDNIYQDYEGLKFWDDTLIGDLGPFDLSDVLAYAYTDKDCTDTDGNTGYVLCQGLAEDGRMVGSTTYYFGLAWELPIDTGNEVQSDEYTADLTFQVEQFRNNPNPFVD